jgi:hypothetical protein
VSEFDRRRYDPYSVTVFVGPIRRPEKLPNAEHCQTCGGDLRDPGRHMVHLCIQCERTTELSLARVDASY